MWADFRGFKARIGCDMRKALCGLALLGCVLSTSEASAQFANRSVGLSPGFIKLFAPDVDFQIPITLDGSLYLEAGFDLFIHIPVAIFFWKVGPQGQLGYQYFGTGGQIGIRYLFLEESIRPYIGIDASLVVVVTDPATVYGGPGIVAGIDFFAADTFSIGPRVFFDLFFQLNNPVRAQLGGVVNFSVYF